MLFDNADLGSALNWLYLLLLLPAAIYYVTTLIGRFGHKTTVRDSSRTDQTKTLSLLNIGQRKPSRHPPAILLIAGIIPAFALLAFGSWALYTWITGRIEFVADFWNVFLLLVFIGLPFYMIIDSLLIQRKYNRLRRSHVAKEAIVTAKDAVDAVFDACYRALDSMQAAIIILQRPNLLEAKVRDYVMTIVIRQIEDSKVRVYVVSDSKWLTVRWDGGANQRNIDNFLRELGRQ